MAGGVPRRRSGESLLSHGCAVPAPPEGKPRVLRTVLAPRIYEGGGPRSGRGSPPPPQREPSQSRFAVPAPPKGEPRGRAPITGHSEPVTDVTGVRIPRMKGAAERQGAAALPLYDLTGSLPGIRRRRTQFFCPGFLSIFMVKSHKNPQQNAESSSCVCTVYAENVHFYTEKSIKLRCYST